MLKKYNDFILENKSTMRIFYSDDFRELLKEISKSSSIAKTLLDSEDNYNELDVYTAIDITDKNDMISYIQVSRIERLNKTGGTNIHRIPDVDLTSIRASVLTANAWKDGRTPYYSIGRWVRHIFVDVKKMPINDDLLGDFVDRYKRAYLSITDPDMSEIKLELVSGEEIRKWYLVDNYVAGSESTDLGRSCMRKPECQTYFEIYEKNPEVCKLLILKSEPTDLDKTPKIKARALLWTIDNQSLGYADYLYLDRIYFVNKDDISYFHKWCKKNKVEFAYDNYSMGRDIKALQASAEVQLGDDTYSEYPYIDTFGYYDPENHRLKQQIDGEVELYKVQNTDGKFAPISKMVWSDYLGEYIGKEESEYCDDIHSYLPRDQTIFLEYKDIYVSDEADVRYSERSEAYYYTDDLVYSECMGDWLSDKDDDYTIICFFTKADDSSDYCAEDEIVYYIEVNGEYYSRENYLKDPYTGEYHFKDELMENSEKFENYLANKFKTDIEEGGNTSAVREKLEKLLLDYEPTEDFKEEIVIKFEDLLTDEYENKVDYLIPAVYCWIISGEKYNINQNNFRESFHNAIFAMINKLYEDEDEIKAIKSFYLEKYPVGKPYGWKRCEFFLNCLIAFDYSKLPVDIYKRILYLEM
jgi:hypothetical protein